MRAINLAKQAGWIDVVPYIAKNSEPKNASAGLLKRKQSDY